LKGKSLFFSNQTELLFILQQQELVLRFSFLLFLQEGFFRDVFSCFGDRFLLLILGLGLCPVFFLCFSLFNNIKALLDFSVPEGLDVIKFFVL